MLTPPVWATGPGRVDHTPTRPDASLTLEDLGTVDGLGRLVQLVGADADDDRSATLNALHLALSVVTRLVVEPFVVDGLCVSGRAERFGLTTDKASASLGCWAGEVEIAPTVDPTLVGVAVGELMRPAMAAVRKRARVGRRATELVVLDALASRCRRAAHRSAIERPHDWIRALTDATGLRSDRPNRWLDVVVDDGPPVSIPVPRVCCVLSKGASDHACPTCPNRSDDVIRGQRLKEWMTSLDEEQFLELSGRRRIVAHVA